MHLARSDDKALGPKECQVLADTLGDTPETVIPVHLLRRGLCHAYVAGDPSRFDGAIIQGAINPGEPDGFGADPEVLWDLLQSVDGWRCVDVAPSCAVAVGAIIEKETGQCVRYYGDVYHTLRNPVARFHKDAVRQLTLADLPLLQAAPVELQGGGFENLITMLTEGIAAGAITSKGLVAIAHTNALTEHHADIGAFTLEEWRGWGFSTAAASIVAQRLQETGRIPVWSTGENNFASLRVAQKLGFTEVSQRVYVIRM